MFHFGWWELTSTSHYLGGQGPTRPSTRLAETVQRPTSSMTPRRDGMTTLFRACSCGEVKVAVRGAASRIGVCHCTGCRRRSDRRLRSSQAGRLQSRDERRVSVVFSQRARCGNEARDSIGSANAIEAFWVCGGKFGLPRSRAPNNLTRMKREGSLRAVLTAPLDSGSCGSSDFARGQERSVENARCRCL